MSVLKEFNPATNQWETILIGKPGAPASLTNTAASDLGVAAAGTSTEAARGDHVHKMPTASDVGADASGTAASAVSSHNSDTTSVHGIANTADLVLTTDSRLSDARTPTDGSVTDAKIVAGGLSTTAITGTAVITTDTRLSDARTPTAHATSHGSAGSDPVTVAQSQVTNLSTDLAAKAPSASPTFTGVPAAPTASADTNTTQLATTAFTVGQAGTATPVVNGTAAVGTSLRYSRQDHVHGTDTTRAPLNSPTFTGTPAAPTAAAGTNTTQLATTAFVTTADNLKANLNSPTFTGTPAAPTATNTTSSTQIATTAYVKGQIPQYQTTAPSSPFTGMVWVDSDEVL
jgi:hypothetical protein